MVRVEHDHRPLARRDDPANGFHRRCVAVLAEDPIAVMASSRIRFIDPVGKVLDAGYQRYDNPDLSSRSAVDRVWILLRRGGFYHVNGITHRDALQRTHLKYTLAWTVEQSRGLPRVGRRSAARVKRLAARARRRLL